MDLGGFWGAFASGTPLHALLGPEVGARRLRRGKRCPFESLSEGERGTIGDPGITPGGPWGRFGLLVGRKMCEKAPPGSGEVPGPLFGRFLREIREGRP